MLRFILVALAAFAALGCGLMLSSAHSQAPPAAIAGEWTGKYICGQGITRLDLEIEQKAGNNLAATFSFGPLPENPDVPTGRYAMTGTWDPMLRRVQLEGVKWIEYPQNYIMVGLDGRMTADGGFIKGIVPTLFNCTDFEVRRPVELIG